MFVVGLTGGMGSGKTTIADLLAQKGAVVVDADVLARDAVVPGSMGLEAIVSRFGREYLLVDGSLDRKALGERVFGDPSALMDLNGIVHPIVRAAALEQIEALQSASGIMLLVVPLLVETMMEGGRYPIEKLVVVDCDDQTAVRRVVASRGWTERQARRRLEAQATRKQRRAVADLVIENVGPPETVVAVAEQLWVWLQKHSGS